MNWIIRKLGAAVISGVGWKLGADAYEFVKQRLQDKKSEGEADQDGAPAAATSVANGNGDGDRVGGNRQRRR